MFEREHGASPFWNTSLVFQKAGGYSPRRSISTTGCTTSFSGARQARGQQKTPAAWKPCLLPPLPQPNTCLRGWSREEEFLTSPCVLSRWRQVWKLSALTLTPAESARKTCLGLKKYYFGRKRLRHLLKNSSACWPKSNFQHLDFASSKVCIQPEKYFFKMKGSTLSLSNHSNNHLRICYYTDRMKQHPRTSTYK